VARFVILGSLLVIAIGVACSDDELPPRAMDLGSDRVPPPGTTDTTPDDAGVRDGAVPDGAVAADGAVVETCAPVVAGDGVNQLDFDDPSIAFEPQSVTARFRTDCVAPGRLQLVLSEDPFCRPGQREVVVDLPETAAVGQTLLLDGVDDVGVRFEDSDGTRFSNLGDCAISTGSVRVERYDTSEAGLQQQVTIELAQLYDCSLGGRGSIVISGTIQGPLEATFADACPDS
jgi:hypothetical protein